MLVQLFLRAFTSVQKFYSHIIRIILGLQNMKSVILAEKLTPKSQISARRRE